MRKKLALMQIRFRLCHRSLSNLENVSLKMYWMKSTRWSSNTTHRKTIFLMMTIVWLSGRNKCTWKHRHTDFWCDLCAAADQVFVFSVKVSADQKRMQTQKLPIVLIIIAMHIDRLAAMLFALQRSNILPKWIWCWSSKSNIQYRK